MTDEEERVRIETLLERLDQLCKNTSQAVVAVSGGVDSVTLAVIAGRALGDAFTAFHAVSPAVPETATERVRAHARRYGWRLEVVDAQELADARYVENPHNRCYFCKSNLYRAIADVTTTQVFSGANADDLGDYRPGLEAAAERGVRHPFVEVGAGKADIRALAQFLGLRDVEALPAMPCLSSRVESGIAIDARDLLFVDTIEELLRGALAVDTVRCRIGHAGVRIELDGPTLEHLTSPAGAPLRAAVEARCNEQNRAFAGYTAYRRGSAFLVPGRP